MYVHTSIYDDGAKGRNAVETKIFASAIYSVHNPREKPSELTDSCSDSL